VTSHDAVRPAARWRTAASLAAAAAIILAVVVPRWSGSDVVVAGADGRMLTLDDGSRVEMRAQSELSIERAADGIDIRLLAGDIIVNAAKQRSGHLYVHTKDMTIAVVGTVFLVNASESGSRVAVIEGEVRVREGSAEKRLRPGDEAATTPTLTRRPLAEDIAWSRNAAVHRAVIDTFMKGVAQSAAPLTPLARQADVTGAQTPGATAAPLEFEEASIRPCDPDNPPASVSGRGGGGPNSLYMTPGRLYVLCITPATLIRTAYGYVSVDMEVEIGWYANPEAPGRMFPISAGSVYGAPPEDGRRVRGGPDWVRTEAYTIEAVAGGLDPKNDVCAPRGGLTQGSRARSGGAGRQAVPPSPNRPCNSANAAAMSGPMLRALLERRFGLKARVVTEQTTAYNLVIAPGGLKMKEGTCTPDLSLPRAQGDEAARRSVDVARRNLDAARRGDATTGLCGIGVADNGPNRVIVGAGAAGAGVAPGTGGAGLSRLLRGILGAPVTDRTGIPDTKRFNYALEFLLDERTKSPFDRTFPAGMDMQIAADPSRVQPAPHLFTALEQQLGLRLEPAQVPRDYIVIDAIRRLEPN
jgi:uncharacterized protein (TIGR03435 family)